MYEKRMQEAFECKLKGRLGTGPEDCKEMRVLNRIVKVTDNGLLYVSSDAGIEIYKQKSNQLVRIANLDGQAFTNDLVSMKIFDNVSWSSSAKKRS